MRYTRAFDKWSELTAITHSIEVVVRVHRRIYCANFRCIVTLSRQCDTRAANSLNVTSFAPIPDPSVSVCDTHRGWSIYCATASTPHTIYITKPSLDCPRTELPYSLFIMNDLLRSRRFLSLGVTLSFFFFGLRLLFRIAYHTMLKYIFINLLLYHFLFQLPQSLISSLRAGPYGI